MKVLVATKRTQDPAKGDFSFTRDGELVFKATSCDSPNHPDCTGCHRALAGTQTRSFTNTVMVADVDYFIDDTDKMHESIKDLRAVAEKYEAGSVLEVQADGFLLREGSHVWQEHFLD